MSVNQDSLRVMLLKEVFNFVERAASVDGVQRIALVGSLTTKKENPKDADVLVTVSDSIDMSRLAMIGRKLKGAGQKRNSGADIFLCNDSGCYLGRTCSYRECHPRLACYGKQCLFGSYLCDDFDVVQLETSLIGNPPIVLWPEIVRGVPVPEDVERYLLSPLESSGL